MPGRTTPNPSGPRNYTAPAHEFGARPNNTVLNRLRVRRDAAGTSNASAQTYIPTNNPSGPLNNPDPAHTVLHQLRVRRDAAESNTTSNGTISNGTISNNDGGGALNTRISFAAVLLNVVPLMAIIVLGIAFFTMQSRSGPVGASASPREQRDLEENEPEENERETCSREWDSEESWPEERNGSAE